MEIEHPVFAVEKEVYEEDEEVSIGDDAHAAAPPQWETWKSICVEKGVEPPPDSYKVFRPLVVLRFRRITDRGWRSKFGVTEEVLERIWRRYYYEFFFYGVEPLHILWKYNKLSSNETWDDMATNWDVSRTSVYRHANFAGEVLNEILDEVRTQYCSITSTIRL